MLSFCFFCLIILSDSLTLSSSDDAKLEVRRFRGLLQEISGSHLRFSATHVIGLRLDKINEYFTLYTINKY